jgi:hypothetical protein
MVSWLALCLSGLKADASAVDLNFGLYQKKYPNTEMLASNTMLTIRSLLAGFMKKFIRVRCLTPAFSQNFFVYVKKKKPRLRRGYKKS